MQNIIPKNWSRETLFSLVALALAYISWYTIGNITFDTYGNTTFFIIEQGLLSLGWYYLLSDLWDWFPPIVSLVFVALSFYTATLAIQKSAVDKSKRGRIFALVFASVSGFVLVMAFLALLIAITSGDGMLLFSSHAVLV